MWRMSRKPSVVTMPVRAPLCSSTALVAMVVPWNTCSIASGGTPFRAQSSRMPAITPSDGSWGVVGTLWIATLPAAVSQSTRSVNVPPMSTPISRIVLPLGSARPGWAAHRVLSAGRPSEVARPGGTDLGICLARTTNPGPPGQAPPSMAARIGEMPVNAFSGCRRSTARRRPPYPAARPSARRTALATASTTGTVIRPAT